MAQILSRKLVTICPICKKLIYGEDIDLNEVNKEKIDRWPHRYIHSHSHEGIPQHSLILYLDPNLDVRRCEISES